MVAFKAAVAFSDGNVLLFSGKVAMGTATAGWMAGMALTGLVSIGAAAAVVVGVVVGTGAAAGRVAVAEGAVPATAARTSEEGAGTVAVGAAEAGTLAWGWPGAEQPSGKATFGEQQTSEVGYTPQPAGFGELRPRFRNAAAPFKRESLWVWLCGATGGCFVSGCVSLGLLG